MTQHHDAARVGTDFLSGVRSGVPGTPTFFNNGVRYNGPMDFKASLAAMEDIAKVQRR
jgi:protein-disulfide isomerase